MAHNQGQKSLEQSLTYLKAQLSVNIQLPDFAFGFLSLLTYQYPSSYIDIWFESIESFDQSTLFELRKLLNSQDFETSFKNSGTFAPSSPEPVAKAGEGTQ